MTPFSLSVTCEPIEVDRALSLTNYCILCSTRDQTTRLNDDCYVCRNITLHINNSPGGTIYSSLCRHTVGKFALLINCVPLFRNIVAGGIYLEPGQGTVESLIQRIRWNEGTNFVNRLLSRIESIAEPSLFCCSPLTSCWISFAKLTIRLCIVLSSFHDRRWLMFEIKYNFLLRQTNGAK